MNYSIIRYVLGTVLKFESLFLLLPVFVGIFYGEKSTTAFLIVAFLCLALGVLLSFRKPKSYVFYALEGFVSVSLSWVLLSFFGALPFWMCGEIPSFTDAMFEAVSGFTTTGASILSDVEALSRCCLFWRSFTHWIGGMGVLVFVLAVFPMRGGQTMFLMKAESPGPSVEKLVPRVRTTATILYAVYTIMTIVEIILLAVTGMSFFDAVTISLGTAGTGGFGVVNDSAGSYAPHLQVIITVFMILFGVNFNIYYLLLRKKVKAALQSEELRIYLGIIVASGLLIAWNIRKIFPDPLDALRHAFFQVGSIITTTGYSTVDFDLWPQFSTTILVMLMFVGACAGSTGGGIKVSRIAIMFKSMLKELFLIHHPHGVRKVKLDGRTVEAETRRSIYVFVVSYVLIYAISLLGISLDNFDFTTNFTAVAATINNIGPGLSMVGPTSNFGLFSDLSKYILMFDMLAGRLELLPMMVLIAPMTWRRR
ncbi:MAG: TrkH family potassium uptake protein [Acetatifactor sp.]|nr:TrkH family potassium uptake protein [Acetatifactor sp.]MDE6699601.1 TrkH family potassium uptake protein [Acetatifactor sp.]